jgi:hypothetical protein
MALPVIADTIRVSVEGLTSQGHRWANVLHFRKTGAITFAAAIAILDPLLLSHYNVASGAGLAMRTFWPTTSSLQLFRYTPLDGVSASTVTSHVFAGLDAAEAMAPSLCCVVTLRTALRGRTHRGRVYQGPFTESQNNFGSINTAFVTGTVTQWTNFRTALTGSGVSLVVAHYPTPTTPAPSAEDVTSFSSDTKWDTQRRRLNV